MFYFTSVFKPRTKEGDTHEQYKVVFETEKGSDMPKLVAAERLFSSLGSLCSKKYSVEHEHELWEDSQYLPVLRQFVPWMRGYRYEEHMEQIHKSEGIHYGKLDIIHDHHKMVDFYRTRLSLNQGSDIFHWDPAGFEKPEWVGEPLGLLDGVGDGEGTTSNRSKANEIESK